MLSPRPEHTFCDSIDLLRPMDFLQVAKTVPAKRLDTPIFVYTINRMRYEFDPTKDESNLDKHGVSLADADEFE